LIFPYCSLPMKKVLVILLILFFSGKVYAENKVLINEFTIEPSQSVELINNSSEMVDISNWYIDDSGGATYFTIPANTILYPNSCLVFSSDFNLNKSSADTLRLFDNTAVPTVASSKLIDSFSYNSSPGTGMSFLRLPDKSSTWTSATSSLGKLNQTGENCLVLPTATPTPTSAPTKDPTTAPSISYENIFISEVMVAPDTGDREWVEFYNRNDFDVSLQNWYIDDEENSGASPKSFSLTIPAKGYSSLELSASVFNNDGDSVRLLDGQKLPKDSLEYTSSVKGKTLGRVSFEDDKFCAQEPTKGQVNGSCLEYPTPTREATQASTSITPTPKTAKQNSASKPSPSQSAKSTLQPTTGGVPDPTGSVLGTNDSFSSLTPQSYSTPVKPLSFLSFSYSLLTIVSILLKMKFNV